ncbi:thiamine pyrophosphate-dependent dehydrogenase E1 component subunit alpha [Kribbella speibonae]|uniref:Thiamine pyrophosphate-dependent dehydrogenase E1 component subunit alpha n=1 Tax=Kribbella speibonae TaxID=1572660 RepID=A0A4R0IZ34_9ACTN|nr:thiamine pyrophosphate-dependent dehydrogenase E1 component subunit alpha [Kribbella speibonae]TCC38230.1 thiamine pyrophosphate-dependent dehydrogenase E1 component subunit alpha [Kribbella speibonae]
MMAPSTALRETADRPQVWLTGAYRQMLFIREFDVRLAELVAASYDVARFIHLSCGQEAVAVGACAAADERDLLCVTYRGHGTLLARGADPVRMIVEILGRPGGYQKGLGGSMHLAATELGIIDSAAIVGGNLPIAVGAGLKLKAAGEGGAVLCFFGDGATATGSFHESLNLAALLKLPVVFICENNRRSSRSAFATYSPVERVADRANAYGMHSVVVDGSDVDAMRAAVTDSRRRAVSGAGPVLVEAEVELLTGHFADSQAGLQQDVPGDPVQLCREHLHQVLGETADAQLAAIESEVRRSVALAFVAAGAR